MVLPLRKRAKGGELGILGLRGQAGVHTGYAGLSLEIYPGQLDHLTCRMTGRLPTASPWRAASAPLYSTPPLEHVQVHQMRLMTYIHALFTRHNT